MFGRKKGRPTKEFSHADDCPVIWADPDVQIEWQQVERGHCVAICQCGKEHHRAPTTERMRLDPLDAKTSRHAPECDFASETNVAVLRALLKITDKGAYSWLECNGCACGWQVPHSAESVGCDEPSTTTDAR